MKNKRLLLLFFCLVFITACTPAKNSSQVSGESSPKVTEELTLKLKESEEKIAVLTKELQQMKDKIKEHDEAMDNFVFISNLTREFIQAHTTGDKEKLAEMLSDELFLVESDDGLFVNVDGYEWLLFSNDSKSKYVDWVIQGYSFDREQMTMAVHTREFFETVNGEPEAPPTFLSLTFKKINDSWKITSLAFDV